MRTNRLRKLGHAAMIGEAQSFEKAGNVVRLAGLLGLAIAIAIVDTVTDLEIAVGVFQVAVVLASVSLLQTRGVVAVAAFCMVLTVVSFLLTPNGSREAGLINCGISLSAIAATTYLVLRMASAMRAVHEARAQLTRIARVNTLGELTASIAHEVNQPLTAVITSGNACLRWLAAQPPNLPKAQQAVERIISDANRASEVIQRVRSLAKRGSPTHKDWLSAADLVSEIVALTQSELDNNQVVLRTRFADDLPPVLADKVQIQQVLLNMILNAIEAINRNGAGKRELRVNVETSVENDVLFSVYDTGIGLGHERIENLFDAFYTSKPDGMGIGLTISRSIIEAHGGRIWATSNPDGGATFYFTLPTAGVEAQ